MKVQIKTATKEEAEEVFEITKQAFQDYLEPAFSSQVPALKESKKEVKADIEHKEVLLAYLGSKPAGSVRFYPLENGIYHLSRLGVKGKFQGKNIGGKLIKAVENRVKKAGGTKIVLYSAYRRKTLLEFYQSLGYKLEDVTTDSDYQRAKLAKVIKASTTVEGC